MRNPSSRRGTLCVRKIGRVALASLLPMLGALLLTTGLGAGQAEAKTPGKTYCFYGKCHRVKTIAETEALVGTEETLSASHYDSCKRDRYNPCGLTSSGEVFDSESPDNAASPIYPDGTTLLVWSPETRVSLVLRVNNAGPYWGNRRLDVSRRAAEVLGFAGQGVATLKVRVVDAPNAEEAKYKKNREYDPVPGYIGEHASLDDAQAAAATAYQVAGLDSPFAPTKTTPVAVAAMQVSGSAGTQSGAAVTIPVAVATADAVPAEPTISATAPAAPVIQPVRVAGFVTVAEADVQGAAETAPHRVASHKHEHGTKRVARKRSHGERVAQRNSRSYRVAARQKRTKGAARSKRATAVASVRGPQIARAPQAKPVAKREGPNDISVFSRYAAYAKVQHSTAKQPQRRPAYAARYAMRDDDRG